MSAITEQFNKSGTLLKALEAASNGPALTMLGATFAGATVIAVLGVMTGSSAMMGITGLLSFLAIITGTSATGYLLMDHAKGIPMRSLAAALLSAIYSLHKLLGVFVLVMLAYFTYVVALLIVLAVCKIPGLGPLLYAVIFPVAALVSGFALIALFYVAFSMLAPAIWDGNGVLASVARLWLILRQRLLVVVVNMLLLALLLFVVTSLVGVVVGFGAGLTLSLSANLIPELEASFAGVLMSLLGGMGGMGGMGVEGGGYLKALMFGAAILIFTATAIPMLVALKGICQIYLNACDGLDFSATEKELEAKVAAARQRAEEARRKAQASMEAARQHAQESMQRAAEQKARDEAAKAQPAREDAAKSGADPQAGQSASARPTALFCPQCGSSVGGEDMFCQACGKKLK